MERTERIQRTAWAGSNAAAGPARSAREMPPVMRRSAPVQPEQVSTPRDDAASAMQGMRAELETLRARLAQAAPRRAVVEMDRAISMLHRQVQDISRAQGETGQAEADHLARELTDLRKALEEMRAPERFQALAAGIDVLTRKIEVMDAKAVSPVEVARLQAQSDELTDLVRRSLSGTGLQALLSRLDACSAQVARAGDVAARKVEAATAAFEHQARELLSRMDHMGQGARMDMDQLHRRLDELGARFHNPAPADPALADHLARISRKLDALGATGKATGPLTAAVEEQLRALDRRFQQTQERLGRLDGIEAGLQQVLVELQHVHASSAEATAEAVQAVALKVSDASDGPAVVGLKRGLAALEARQNEVERRASAWLGEPFHDDSLVLGRTDDGVWAPHAEDMPPPPQTDMPASGMAEAVDEEHPEPLHREPVFETREDSWHSERRTEPRWASSQSAPTAERAGELPPDAEFDAAFAEALGGGRQEPAFDSAANGPRPGRQGPAQASHNDAQSARPRVKRPVRGQKLRPRPHHVGWKGVAASVLAVALVSSAGLVWIKRDALQTHASALMDSLAARSAGVASMADLPAPVGPAALQADARAGNLAAAHEVAVRYAEGKGTPVDLDAALKWLGYAVSKGSAQAAFTLGSLYENDVFNPAEAKRFYGWAAEQGHVQAMHNLAALHAQGINGKGADWEQAIHWFRSAAEYGKRDAQHNLGVIHARGLSGHTDLKEALNWFSIAANQGDTDSAQKRDELASRMDPALVDEVRRRVAAFRARPVNEAVNTLALRPEWADPAADKMAGRGRARVPAQDMTQAPRDIPAQMFSGQSINSMSGQMLASRR